MATIKKTAVLATGVKHVSSVESVIDMHIYLVSCLNLYGLQEVYIALFTCWVSRGIRFGKGCQN